MHIDHGVDTGEIIHQIRVKINFNDNIHQIGNRLIRDSFFECVKLVKNFEEIKKIPQTRYDCNQFKFGQVRKRNSTIHTQH